MESDNLIERFLSFLSKLEFIRAIFYFISKFPLFLALFICSTISFNNCPYLSTFILLSSINEMFYVSLNLFIEVIGCYIRFIITISLNSIVDIIHYLFVLAIEIYGFVILVTQINQCYGGGWQIYQLISFIILFIHGLYTIIDITNFISVFLLTFTLFSKKTINKEESHEDLE